MKLGTLASADRFKDNEKLIINVILDLVHFSPLLTQFLRTPVSLTSDRIECLTMDVQIKIWDLPRTEEQAIMLFQDKGLLPKTKHCVNWYT